MENNDSNIKPKQTGGLKLMTVFIAVLALHVVVIGGFTAYNLMKGGSADADIVTTDKTHKDLKGSSGTAIADGTIPDASQGDKSTPSTPAATPPTEVATIPQATSGPANPSMPALDLTAPPILTTSTPAPAPMLTPKPTPLTPPVDVVDKSTPTGPIAPALLPPPEPAPSSITSAPAPAASLASGPVHMPPAASSAPVHEHGQTYTVKITDSYKKIAKAHHITVAQLKEANHIKSDTLHTGQKLVIPSEKALVAEKSATPTPSLEASPTAPVLGEPTPVATASLASVPSTETATVPHQHVYTIVKGDTLTKIAHKFKTTTSAIMTENSINDPTKLTIGKKLKIPSQESRSARATPPAATQPSQVQAQPGTPSGQLANFVP